MRRTILRALALVGAVTGLGLVVAHAGMTVGCNHGTTPESQAPVLSNAAAADDAPATTPTPPPASTSPPGAPGKGNAPAKAKDRTRYMPATKAAPVFWPQDVENDDAPIAQPPQRAPQPQNPPAQNAAPQQQSPKGGR